jgi:hypothetical protein
MTETESEMNWPRQAAVDLITLPEQVVGKRAPIRYGDFDFSAPRLIFKGPVPATPGLFVIHVRNRRWFAPEYEPIEFGESANLYRQLLVDGSDEVIRWLTHPKAKRGLFVSVCPTTAMDKLAREFAASRLLARYRPDMTRSVEEFLAELDDPLAGYWREHSAR